MTSKDSCVEIDITPELIEGRKTKASFDPESLKLIPECLKVTHPGNKQVGHVFHLNQYHGRRFGFSRSEDIIEGQVLIMKQLIQLAPDYVVSEGGSSGLHGFLHAFAFLQEEKGESKKQKVLEFLAGKMIRGEEPFNKSENPYVILHGIEVFQRYVKEYFPDGIETDFDNLSKDQKMLFASGAAPLYAILTKSPTIKDYHFKDYPHFTKFDKEAPTRETFTLREQATQKTIKSILEKNPGKTVALIYGSSHNFSNEMVCKDICPVFTEVNFPHADYVAITNELEIDSNYQFGWSHVFGADFASEPESSVDDSDASTLWSVKKTKQK